MSKRLDRRPELIPHRLILKLLQTTSRTHLHRGCLLAGVDPAFVQSIPLGPNPLSQLLLDLDILNHTGRLEDGNVPLETWLLNAIALLRPRAEAGMFRRVLRRLKSSHSSALLAETSPSKNREKSLAGPSGSVLALGT